MLKEVPEKVAVRTLLVTYSGRLHIVTLEGSGIRTVGDLKGKRVSMGPPGGGSESAGLLVFEAYGITPQDLGSHLRLGYAESATALGSPTPFHPGALGPGKVRRALLAWRSKATAPGRRAIGASRLTFITQYVIMGP